MTRAWIADLGDGTYRNPVLNADRPDPDVIRVGDDHYLTASSFGCAPGLPHRTTGPAPGGNGRVRHPPRHFLNRRTARHDRTAPHDRVTS